MTKLKQELEKHGIQLVELDANTNKKKMAGLKIHGFQSFIKQKPDGTIKHYEGLRRKEDLMDFVKSS